MTDGHSPALALLLALWLLGACRAAPERVHDDLVFGPATGPLRLGAPVGDGSNLGELVREHARLCGFELVVDEATDRALEAEPIGLLREADVSRGEVSTFVESLLAVHGWIYAVGAESPARVVSVHRVAESSTVAARAIDPADLPRYAGHRAVAIETVVPAPAGARTIDVALLASPGTGLTAQVLGADGSTLLRGPAHDVAELALVLTTARSPHSSDR